MCNCITCWFCKLKDTLPITSHSIYGFSEMKGCIIITLNSSLTWFSAKLYFWALWLVYRPLLFQNFSAADAILPCLQSRGGTETERKRETDSDRESQREKFWHDNQARNQREKKGGDWLKSTLILLPYFSHLWINFFLKSSFYIWDKNYKDFPCEKFSTMCVKCLSKSPYSIKLHMA